MSGSAHSLVGRAAERERLVDAVKAARAGVPRTVSILGEAGIGKTHLLEEAGAFATQHGCLVLTGAAAEFESELPFGVVIDAFDDYIKSLDDRALDRLALDRLGALGLVLPSLSSISAAVDVPVSAIERYRLHRAVAELMERLAARQALVCVLDDLHWADDASAELLAHLARKPPQGGIALLLGARPGQGSAFATRTVNELRLSSAVETIELDPLDLESTTALVGVADAARAAELHHLSGGNPFYALQLARTGDVTRSIQTNGGTNVPDAVRDAIVAELERLDPAQRLFASAASVVGDPFDLGLAIAAAACTDEDALDIIDQLARRQLIHSVTTPRSFAFRHPLVRNAIYHATSPGTRLTGHRRLLVALQQRSAPPAQLAIHVEQAATFGDRAAIDVLRAAAREAAIKSPATAARWLSTALDLLPPSAPAEIRVNLLTSIAAAHASLGHFDDAFTALVACIRAIPADQPDARVRTTVSCAEIEQLLGHHMESQQRLLRAFDELPTADSAHGAILMLALASNSFYLADYAGMHDWAQRSLEPARRLADPALLAAALAASTMAAAFSGTIDVALHIHGDACALIDELHDDVLVERLDALCYLSTAELYLDRYIQSCEHGERCLRLARQSGRTQLVPLLTPVLGCSLFMCGRMDRSAEVLDESIEAARLANNRQGTAMALFDRALAALHQGDLDGALTFGAESVALAEHVDVGLVTACAGAVFAQALLEAGDPRRSLDVLLTSTGGENVPNVAGSWRATFLELLTRCHLALGDTDRAEAASRHCRQLASELGLHLPTLMADRAEALVALARHEPARATELARTAIEASDASGAIVHTPTSRALLGRALITAGQIPEGVEELGKAAVEYESLGATRYRDQVASELRRHGITVHRRSRPGKRGALGMASLSGRELEVAELIRRHATNREIASELFLSMKTVETHVRNIFNKLGVTSRGEIARTLDTALAQHPR